MTFEMENADLSKNNIDGKGNIITFEGEDQVESTSIYDYVSMALSHQYEHIFKTL